MSYTEFMVACMFQVKMFNCEADYNFYNHLALTPGLGDSSSSSDTVQGSVYRTLGDLEWEVESTTVTHSSADWWDLLLPLA